MQSSEALDRFINSMDSVVSMVSQTVLEYERRILEANVCWRSSNDRPRQRPKTCQEGYRWDGQQSCTKLSSLLSKSSEFSSLDATVRWKSPDTSTTVLAQCDEETGFNEKYNHWCYGPCDTGFSVTDDTKCITTCNGKFPVESSSGYLCGRDQEVLVKAQVEMITVVVNGLFDLHEAIQKMNDDGINGETLSSTIQVFIDMGQAFAKPTCPVGTEPGTDESLVPTPLPTIGASNASLDANSTDHTGDHDVDYYDYVYDYNGSESVSAETTRRPGAPNLSVGSTSTDNAADQDGDYEYVYDYDVSYSDYVSVDATPMPGAPSGSVNTFFANYAGDYDGGDYDGGHLSDGESQVF